MDVKTLENGNRQLPMACCCGDRKEEMLALNAEVSEMLGVTDPRFFVSTIIYSMNFWFKDRTFTLAHVYSDMWMSVAVDEHVHGEGSILDERPVIFAHCDIFEDGLATIFKYLVETYERDEDSL